jgi:hypothetical protein
MRYYLVCYEYAIILDEAHECSLNIDFLLGHLKDLLARHKDLKLVVTSATIDTQAFSRHCDNAPIIEVSGRLYPVEVKYQPSDAASEEQGEVRGCVQRVSRYGHRRAVVVSDAPLRPGANEIRLSRESKCERTWERKRKPLKLEYLSPGLGILPAGMLCGSAQPGTKLRELATGGAA